MAFPPSALPAAPPGEVPAVGGSRGGAMDPPPPPAVPATPPGEVPAASSRGTCGAQGVAQSEEIHPQAGAHEDADADHKKILGLSSVCCSFVLQSFNIVVKRTGSHSVPAITVSNHQAPTLTPREVLSTRKSHATTDSPIDTNLIVIAMKENKSQVQDDRMGMSKIA